MTSGPALPWAPQSMDFDSGWQSLLQSEELDPLPYVVDGDYALTPGDDTSTIAAETIAAEETRKSGRLLVDVNGCTHVARIVDISICGVAFDVTEPLNIGAAILLRTGKAGADPLVAGACIVRQVPLATGHRVVCRFHSRANAEMLRELGRAVFARSIV